MAGRGGKRSTSWKPGQTGNPGGRPKLVTEVRDLARQHTDLAVAALIEIVSDKTHAQRALAANALLDRGWGRPTQMIETPNGGDGMAALRSRLDRVEALARAAFGISAPDLPVESDRPTVQ